MKLPKILDNRHMKVVRVSALRTAFTESPPRQEIFFIFISVRDLVYARATVQLEGLTLKTLN